MADTASLRGNALFRVSSRKLLAERLLISEPKLQEILALEQPYTRKWKSKKGDHWLNEEPSQDEAKDYRPIDIPAPSLKSVQSRVAKLLASSPTPNWLFSPVKGRSYVENAARHKDSTAFWMLDIADYFPSCSSGAVAGLFRNELECPPDVASILTSIATKDGCIPQGSPCSPIVAFYSKIDMWNQIASIVEQEGVIHSVYADDITISGHLVRGETVWEVKKQVRKHGLRLRGDKEESRFDRPADITGVIVANGRLRLPNRQAKRLFELRQKRHAALAAEREMIDRQIAGRQAQRRQVEGANL